MLAQQNAATAEAAGGMVAKYTKSFAVLQATQFPRPSDAEGLELRREHFGRGRQILLEKGVPFDPDE